MEIIKLNLIPSGNNPVCHCSQYDNGRIIRAELFDGLTPYSIASGDSLTLNVRKPDNTIVSANLTTTQGNTYVDFATTEQICAVVGKSLAEIKITNGTTVIGTLNFIIEVERDVLADGIPSESVIEDLEELIAEAIGDDYYNKTEIDAALALKADSADVNEAIDELERKKVDYADLPKVSDNEPYLIRKTANGKRVGSRLFDKLVGGTVAFNQLVYGTPTLSKEGIITSYANGVFTIENESRSTNYSSGSTRNAITYNVVKANHKYIFIASSSKNITGVGVRFNTKNGVETQTFYPYNSILTPTEDGYYVFRINYTYDFESVHPIGDITTFKAIIIDLTQMLGSTIADYIDSLEQATAGAGVAFFRRLFPKDYYAYNDGELMSVKTSAHKTRGFNQFDDQMEIGGINFNTGVNASNNDRMRSKNYIPVIAGARYWFSPNYDKYIFFYDANYNPIVLSNNRIYAQFTPATHLYTVPVNCAYVRLLMWTTYGTTYKNDICLNLYDTAKNGTYEPYIEHTYELDNDLELRGIPKLDSNNQLYYDGDTYESSGKVTRKYALVDLGSLNWSLVSASGGNKRFAANLATIKVASSDSVLPNMICKKYPVVTPANTYNNIYGISNDTAARLTCFDSSYNDDPAAFKSAMSGVYLLYELATPTTETADAYKDPQICDDSGSEEYIDTRAVSIPVGHITEYVVDLDTSLLPNTPTADGTYTLKCTITDGIPTYSWIQDI